jgi:DNA-binding beta-propeller fold protein YncE/quercetin dioxygenase-like cupin family protein
MPVRTGTLRASIAALAALLAITAHAQAPVPPGPYSAVQELSRTGSTAVGEPIRYGGGHASVRTAVVTLRPGESTARHRHDTPLFVYILEGEVAVDYEGYGRRTYRAGDSFMEAMESAHAATNVGTTPVRILAAFLETAPTTPPELIVVEQEAGQVSAVDPRTGQVRARARVGLNPHEIELSDDGATAWVTNFGITDYDRAVGVPGTSVSVIRLADVKETARLELPGVKAPHGVKLRPGGRELFVNAEDGDRMVVFDPDTGKVLRTFAVTEHTHNLLFSRDGTRLYLMAGPAGVRRVDPDTGAVQASRTLATPTRGLAWMPGESALLASGKGELDLLDPVTLEVRRHLPVPGAGQIIYSVPTPDGRSILAPAPYDGKVFVVDLASGAVRSAVETGKAPILVTLDPDGREAWVSNALDDHMTAVDLGTLRTRRSARLDFPNGAAFSVRRLDGPSLVAETRAQLDRLFAALASGDAEKVRPWLTPEFQVVRSTGMGYDRESYLARSIPRLAAPPRFEDLVVTRGEGHVVARFRLHADENIDGKRARSGAPQLIVFRVEPGSWKVVAAANFAALEP